MSGRGGFAVDSGGDAQVLQHDRACPAGIEVQLLLLCHQFLFRERRERLVPQVQFEFGNRQVQWTWLRRRSRFWQRLAGGKHQRANPVAFEGLLFLLGGDFFRRERREGFVQQVEFKFSDWQEQRLRRFDLGLSLGSCAG